MGLFDRILKRPEQLPQAQNPQQLSGKKKILIVEADQNLRYQYIQAFQQANYEVTFAGDGASGLNALLNFTPDLIVIDLELPIMNGVQMLHSLRALPAHKYTPVIAISEKTDADTVRQVKTFDNANALLLKSTATPQLVIETVQTLI